MFRLSGTQIAAVALLLTALGGVYKLGQQASPESPARIEARLERIETKLSAITEQLIQAGVHTAYNAKRMDQHDMRLDDLQRRIENVARRDYPPMKLPFAPIPNSDMPSEHPVLPMRDEERQTERGDLPA